MIAHRIKQARLAAGMTQRDVAELLDITKAAISKYETGKSEPSASMILKLAQALRTSPNYLLHEPAIRVGWLAYRKRSRLAKSAQQHIQAYAERRIEMQAELKNLLYPDDRPNFPTPQVATSFNDAEQIANDVRQRWYLYDHPIEDFVSLIEDHGAFVIEWDQHVGKFDGLSGWVNEQRPVMVINTAREIASDRRRFSAAHELGHLLMDCRGVEPKEEERLAHRFAAALLAPAKVMRHELGEKRTQLNLHELGLLKQKVGLSISALIYRARDLEIITASHAQVLWKRMSANQWNKDEPYKLSSDELPTRLKQMTLRAYSEGLISEDGARELCPDCIPTPLEVPQEPYPTARDLLRMPQAEREAYMEQSFAAVADEDIELFEAFDEADFDDEYEYTD